MMVWCVSSSIISLILFNGFLSFEQVERLLPVASEKETQQFSYVLSKQAYHSLSEEHLWFSIFSRPPSAHFTRVQRCTCCFVLLYTAMLLNILYYDQSTETKMDNSLSLGPLHISAEQVCQTYLCR